MPLFVRHCPKCNNEIVYSHQSTMVVANKNNSRCKSCTKYGVDNPFYGKKHGD